MALAQHERSMSEEEEEDEEHGFVELDPTSRYGRYSEVLGKGACKTVYRGFDEVEGIEVAWNQVRMQSALESPDGLERLFSEVHLLKALKHKNIMKFYHSWVDTERKNLNFITELFTSGTLRQYRKKHKRVNIKALKNWSRQILRGLLYLHSHDPPIIHRDLKCDNIFINGNQGEVKIGDLGLATILQQAQAPHGVIGTPEFMAPELYEEDYNELIDIYSFGMSLLEMATFEYPYSECKTAAHIYKKVISGKKPAALNMVDDPELRQFIEKCLAKASKRLPARELLTDPFLHLEGDCQALAHSPQSNLAVTCMDDLDDLGLSIDEVNEGSAFMQIRYKQNDWLSANNATPIPPAANGFKSFAGNLLEPVACFHAKADKGRSFGVSVKGKIREDDTVLLRLRITDSEGQVRNIHFPFDIECDTAMSVASEMVVELDFTDQDIPKIAELIDMAIVALIPEWKSGVAIDENFGGDAESILKKHCNVFSSEEIYPRPKPCSTFSSNPSEIIVPDVRIAPRVEGIMHGRFEEFTHHHQMPVLYNYLEEEGTVSCGSLDMINGPVCWDSTEDTECLSSPVSYKSCPGSGSVENWPLSQKCEIVENTESEDSSDELICERNSGLARICENTKYGDPYPVRRHISQNKVEDGNFYWWKSKFQDTTLSSLPSFGILPILDDVDDTDTDTFVDDTAEELRELALKHEEELRELQHKHEAAFLQLRNKCRQKRSFCSLASSTNKQQIDSSCSSLDSEHDSHAEFLNWPYASEARTFSSQRITRLSRIASENDKETRSIRETPLEGIDSSSLEGIDSSSLTSELHM